MGTTVSVSLAGPVSGPGSGPGSETESAVREIFAGADRSYSLYRPDSELSRIAAGELALPDSSAEMKRMYALALDWRSSTEGAFTPHRPDGVLDLSGVVKAWAMAAAGGRLASAGYSDWCLNAGGDVLCSGTAAGGGAWSVGIVDPLDRTALLGSIDAVPGRPAVATSGSAERGEHIWRAPGSPRDFIQVTVRAPDIITADVLATAVMSGGTTALDRASSGWPVDILAVRPDGGLLATPGFLRRY